MMALKQKTREVKMDVRNSCFWADLDAKMRQEEKVQQKLQEETLQQEKLHQQQLEQEKLKQQELQKEKLQQEKLQQQLEQEKLQQQLEQEKLKQQELQQEKLKQQQLQEEKLKQQQLQQEKLKGQVQQRKENVQTMKVEEVVPCIVINANLKLFTMHGYLKELVRPAFQDALNMISGIIFEVTKTHRVVTATAVSDKMFFYIFSNLDNVFLTAVSANIGRKLSDEEQILVTNTVFNIVHENHQLVVIFVQTSVDDFNGLNDNKKSNERINGIKNLMPTPIINSEGNEVRINMNDGKDNPPKLNNDGGKRVLCRQQPRSGNSGWNDGNNLARLNAIQVEYPIDMCTVAFTCFLFTVVIVLTILAIWNFAF